MEIGHVDVGIYADVYFTIACDFLTCPTNSYCMEDGNNIASCQCYTGYQTDVDSDGLLRCMGMLSSYLLQCPVGYYHVHFTHDALVVSND